MKKHLPIIVLVVLILVGSYIVGHHVASQSKTNATQPAHSAPKTTTVQTPAQAPSFDKTQYSLSDPNSQWVVVDKQRPLNPVSYAPANLVIPSIPLRSNITSTEEYVRSETAAALKTMADAASAQGVTLNLQSGYRSYNFQVSLYNSYVASQGQAAADRSSARAGYSEHQTGWAADLGGTSNPSCNVAQCFADTAEGKWLATNANTYGFIIRYPEGKESVTGYEYEPWHVRYVGTALSQEMQKTGITTIEQFFGLPDAPTY